MDYRYHGFLIDEDEIVPLYDFPHLLKEVRNNFLTKELRFPVDGVQKVASWKHMVQLYESVNTDKADHELTLCLKLTDFHIIPDKIKKMK
ncbi:hypothetical protein ILUMI_08300, partial [Ignelater luminosus]